MIKHRRAVANRLLKWFAARERDLPWLVNRSPYRIWVSEIMLQQTQIITVLGYYRRFIQRFPDVRSLAEADVEEVLKLWEGLGYYRRARQLHAAANQIVENHNGDFPEDVDDVLALPGIGRYTAAAILSIARDQRLPILEGNTVRLFSRLIALQDDTTTSNSQKTLWQISEALLPRKRAGDFNQAVMDFGREVCRPSSPNCDHCPVAAFCEAARCNLQSKIPYRAAKMQYTDLREAIVLIRRGKKVLVRKCSDGERWEGLWDFPRFELHTDPWQKRLESDIKKSTGLNTVVVPLNQSMNHAVTRYRINLQCFAASSVAGRLKNNGYFKWKTTDDVVSLPLNVTGRKFADLFVSI